MYYIMIIFCEYMRQMKPQQRLIIGSKTLA